MLPVVERESVSVPIINQAIGACFFAPLLLRWAWYGDVIDHMSHDTEIRDMTKCLVVQHVCQKQMCVGV